MTQTILVTGATSGFGRACAERFGAEGHRLILAGRRRDRLSEVKAALAGRAEALTLPLDVRDRKAVFAALGSLPDPFREVDVLVNNAGLALGLEPAQAADLDDWETMVDTNIKGLMYCTRAILPGMVERERGHVVNVGSIAGAWRKPTN